MDVDQLLAEIDRPAAPGPGTVPPQTASEQALASHLARPENVDSLKTALATERDPARKAVMQDELARVTGSAIDTAQGRGPANGPANGSAIGADDEISQLVKSVYATPAPKPQGSSIMSAIRRSFHAPEITPTPDAPVQALDAGELGRPARMVLTPGGQPQYEQPPEQVADTGLTEPPATPEPGVVQRVTDFAKKLATENAAEETRRLGQRSTDIARREAELQGRSGSSGELAARARYDAAHDLAMGDFWRNVEAGTKNVPPEFRQSLGAFLQAVGDGITSDADTPAVRAAAAKLAGMGADFYDQGQQQIDENTKGLKPGLGAQTINSAMQSVAQMVPALLAGALTKNPATVIEIMSTNTAAQSYGRARAQGFDPGDAFKYALFQGIVEGGTEYLPVKALLARSPKGLVSRYYNFLVREVPSELAATLLQDSADRLTVNPRLTLSDLMQDLVVTATSTPIAAGAQVAAVHGAGQLPSGPNLTLRGAPVESPAPGTPPGAVAPPSAPVGAPTAAPGAGPGTTPPAPPAAPWATHRLDDGTPVRQYAENGQPVPGVWMDARGDLHEANPQPVETWKPTGAAAAPTLGTFKKPQQGPAGEGADAFSPTEAQNKGARPSDVMSKVYTPAGREVETVWAVVDARDVGLSHDIMGRPNPNFPPGLQKRDLGRAAAVQWVMERSKTLIPEKLGESPNAGDGAPIVSPELQGETGRKRTLAVQLAYQQGTAAAYRAFVDGKAKQYGIDTAGIEQPMLVRIRTTPMTEQQRVEFADEADTPEVTAMAPLEQAKADSTKLTPELMASFEPGEDGNLLGPSNRVFFQRFASDIVGAGQQAAYITKEGRPTKQLSDRMQAAIFQRAYGNEALTQLLVEEADPEIKNVISALNVAARQFSSMPEAGELDVRPHLAAAAQLIRQAKIEGRKIEEVLATDDMFGRSPFVSAIAQFMAKNIRSPRRMGAGFAEMGRFIEDDLIARKNGDMFGGRPVPTIADILTAANRFLEENYGEEATLFGDLADQPGAVEAGGEAGKRQREGPGEPAPEQPPSGPAAPDDRDAGGQPGEDEGAEAGRARVGPGAAQPGPAYAAKKVAPAERRQQKKGPPATGERRIAVPVASSAPAALSELERARAEVDRQPTEAEKAAGNYAKGHIVLNGIPISIENPKGSVRRGVDANGKPWESKLPWDYGYIKRTEGADGDHVDVFIGPDLDSPHVFIVDQNKAGGAFDEHKVMLGFDNEQAARAGYLAAYNIDMSQRIGAVTVMSFPEFKEWLANGDTAAPAVEAQQARPVYNLTYEVPGARAEQTGSHAPSAAAGVPRQLEIFTDGVVPEAPRAIQARYATEVRQVVVGSFKIGVERVSSPEDAAHVLAPLRRETVESMLALVLDAQDRPIAIIRHTIGAVTEANVYPGLMLRSVASVPGAASFYMGHNHPSGRSTQSSADKHLATRVASLAKGSGLTYKGSLVVTHGRSATFLGPELAEDAKVTTGAAPRSREIAIRKDMYRRFGTLGAELDSPAVSKRMGRELLDGKPGMILLSARHAPVAAIPMSLATMGRLRGEVHDPMPAARGVIEAMARSNAVAAVIYGQIGDETRNLATMLDKFHVKVLDIIHGDDSAAERGDDLTRSTYFAQGWDAVEGGGSRGMNADLLRTRLTPLIRELRYPVKVIQRYSELPQSIRDNAKKRLSPGHEQRVRGVFDAEYGEVWVVADNTMSVAHAEKTIVHELVGHFGLHRLLGKELDPVLRQIYAARAREIAQMMKTGILQGYQFDLRSERDQLKAAEEYLSFRAEKGEDQTLVQRAFASIRRGLRALGFQLTYSDGDIVNLLRRSRENLRGALQGQFAIGSDYSAGDTWDNVFTKTGQRKVGGGAKTTPADEYTWSGTLDGKPITVVSTVRNVERMASFLVNSSQRINYGYSGPVPADAKFVDLEVDGPDVTDAELRRVANLAARIDSRPVLARRKGEPVRTGIGPGEDTAFADDSVERGLERMRRRMMRPVGPVVTPELRAAIEASDRLGFDTVAEAAGAILDHEDWKERWDATGDLVKVGDAWRESALAMRRYMDDDVSFAMSRGATEAYGTVDNAVKGYARKIGGAWEVYLATGPTLTNPASARRMQAASANEVRRIFNASGLEFNFFRPGGTEFPEESLFGPFDVPEESLWDKVVQKLQDKMRRLATVQRGLKKQGRAIDEVSDAYLHEEVYHGIAAGKLEDFNHDYIEPLVDKLAELKQAMPEALGREFSRAERGQRFDELQAAGLWLYARHAPERNAAMAEINPDRTDKNSGMTDAEAAEIAAKFEAAGLTPLMQQIGAIVDRINAFRLKTLVEKDLMSPKAEILMRDKYKAYVPLRGRDDIDEDHLPVGRGYDVRGKEVRRAFGRMSKADPAKILAYTIAQAQTAIVRGEKNEVGKAFLKLVEANPNDEIWEVNRVELIPHLDRASGEVVYGPDPFANREDNVLSVKVRGEQHYVTIFDDALARGMRNFGATAPDWVRVMATITQYFAMINTAANPEFVLSNFLRDLQTAVGNLTADQKTNIAAQLVRDIPAAMYGAWKGIREHGPAPADAPEWQKHYREYVEAGGKINFLDMRSVEQRAVELSKMVRDATPSTMRKLAVLYPKAIGNFIFDLNGAVENATRLAGYVNARRAGISPMQAASLARNLTVNFNRRGELGSAINALYAFYNASVQGSATVLRFMSTKRGFALALALAAIGGWMDWVNRLLGGKDKDGKWYWDKVPAYERERNIIVMDPFSPGARFKIPMAYGWNVPYVLGQETVALLTGNRKPGAAAAQAFKAVMGAFNPLGSDQIAQMLAPTVVDPFLQHALNQDFAGRPIKPEPKGFGPRPPESEQFWPRTPAAYVNFSHMLNEVTGGNEVRSGLLDVSPNVVQHYLRSFTGGAGEFYTRIGAAAYGYFSEGELPATRELPFVRRLYAEDTGSELHKAYYERLGDIRRAVEEQKHYSAKGDRATVLQAQRDHRIELGLYASAQVLDEGISDLRKQVRQLRDSQLPRELKRERIKRIEAEVDTRMKNFVREYDRLTQPQD
jgi:hypothetical protein